MSLKSDYYKNLLLSISRGNYRGLFSNAKPFLLIALFDAIKEGHIIGNVIKFDNTHLISLYRTISHEFEPTNRPTPFAKPFFHLNSEPFYIIRFKPDLSHPKQSTTPSSKFLREQVEYASFDDDLWNLLQEPDVIEEYRQAIIQHFIKR